MPITACGLLSICMTEAGSGAIGPIPVPSIPPPAPNIEAKSAAAGAGDPPVEADPAKYRKNEGRVFRTSCGRSYKPLGCRGMDGVDEAADEDPAVAVAGFEAPALPRRRITV